MAKKIVTLYIDDTSLRLMVTKGKKIKHWVETPLEAGLIKNSLVIEEDQVTARIRHLFDIEKVRTKNIAIGISGLHCLSRPISLPQLPKAMLAEAIMREAKRVLPVPLEQLYVSWQTIPSPEGKTGVFLVAIPRKTADALFKVLHQAKLKPYLLDLKPLLLSRLVKNPTAIVLDVQAAEFDIVILADGIPQPIRTISFPKDSLSLAEKLPLIKGDLERTIKFHNSNNQDKPLTPNTPIYVSGELGDDPGLCQSLSSELGYPILPLSPPFDRPWWLDTSHYMVNIGLVLQQIPSRNGDRASLINVNALPVPYRPKPPSLINIFALPVAIIVLALTAYMVTLTQGAYAYNALLRGQLNVTNQLLSQKTAQRQLLTGEITTIEGHIATIQASSNSFIKARDNIVNQRNGINRNLPLIAENLPPGISLSSITFTDNTLRVTGSSNSDQEILSYLNSLDASNKMGKMTVTSMTKTPGQEITFTFVINCGG
ncbi:MAG: pilus assembly protein PilM [Dehalococcoidales bacterium]|nr:pilus assembly protein PilM [Dehalococcoidales bacterium]